MKFAQIAAASALLALSAGTFAAKPTSIVFQGNHETTAGAAYSEYLVKCSNGKTATKKAATSKTKSSATKKSAAKSKTSGSASSGGKAST